VLKESAYLSSKEERVHCSRIIFYEASFVISKKYERLKLFVCFGIVGLEIKGTTVVYIDTGRYMG